MTITTTPPPAAPPATRRWTTDDALRLYNIPGWGNGYFGINAAGCLVVHPAGPGTQEIDLKELVEEVRDRGIGLPLLLRFSELLAARLDEIHRAFGRAIEEFGYRGRYQGVYPIKVNQDRYVVERLVDYGAKYHFGLEAGSKPELLAVIAMLQDPEALIVCNGYKDAEYVETALLASKLGRQIVLVVEKPSELPTILAAARRTGVPPLIGLRARLASRGFGHWEDSGGEKSKFGLSGRELVEAVEFLRAHELLESCRLLHFHIGSQVSSIHAVKEALREAAWVYVNLVKSGAPLRYLDVGGGLGVDYNGSGTTVASSINYNLQEYANDIVYGVMEICDTAGVEHPTLVTEAGRATVAHHAVLVLDVLGGTSPGEARELPPPSKAPLPLRNLFETFQEAATRAPLEVFHDAVAYRDECLNLFRLGYLSLAERGLAEDLFREICRRLQKSLRGRGPLPEELDALRSTLAETYFCNFSIFQSLPDSWAIEQIFPVVPLHRLDETPDQDVVLADITCDSDGKVDRFIGAAGVEAEAALRLPAFTGPPLYLGIFLVGAYQEILGDLHNLFGDTNTVVVSLHPEEGYVIDHVAMGDSVTEVLEYVNYDPRDLLARMRQATETALRAKRMSLEESRELLRMYQEGLAGYTYLEGE